MKVLNEFRVPGFAVRELSLRVPLNHGLSYRVPSVASPHVHVFAKELSRLSSDGKKKPYLVFLQGGPGFPAPIVVDGAIPAWAHRASKDYTVLLVDQRGTGLSSPITTELLGGIGSADDQCDYLSHFRADSIVADCEAFRVALGLTSWSLLGQSYGGFIITRYLSSAPAAITEVLLTGGLPITRGPLSEPRAECVADALYRNLARRVARRNEHYYSRYPQDIAAVRKIVECIRQSPQSRIIMRGGGCLTVERFASIGLCLGFHGGCDTLHNLVATAFPTSVDGSTDETRLSGTFLRKIESLEPWETNPIYALLHESIYCDGGVPSKWSAHRVMQEPEFAKLFGPALGLPVESSDNRPFYFTGEMVFPWMFRDIAALQPLAEAAELLAKKSWPPLYEWDGSAGRRDHIRGAAIVYFDDMYVDREFSLETAKAPFMPPNMAVWVTNEFDHGGLRSDGTAIFERLVGLANGEIAIR